MSFLKRLELCYSYYILRVARDVKVRLALKVKMSCEYASKSSDDGGGFPRLVHFVKRLPASFLLTHLHITNYTFNTLYSFGSNLY